MRKHIYLVLFFLMALSVSGFAEKEKAKDFGFAKHNAEVQVTPHADYLIYAKGKDVGAPDAPYENRYPFIGFNFGARYMFRPIELLAVSAGLAMHMQGGFWRQRAYFPKEYVALRQNYHVAALMLPIYLHLFKQMANSTFEFAIGPDFYFPVFQRTASATYNPDGEKVNSDKDFDKYTTQYARQNAVFGLSIFLGAQLYVCPVANLFIGPQIAFMNLAYMDKDKQENRLKFGGFYDVYLGLKLGFRFHCKGKGDK
ncbi:MAG: hypothetical protein KIS94_11365 [Chitinophagales bacterium]|nr:hypothetical protein [Chitinophagales bacterium]